MNVDRDTGTNFPRRAGIRFEDNVGCEDAAAACAGRGEAADAQGLADRVDSKAVVVPCLISEAEESEEDESTDDGRPSGKLQLELGSRACTPKNGGVLIDPVKERMCVVPRDPPPEIAEAVNDDDLYAIGNGADDFDGGQTHEAEIATGGEIRVVREKLVKLSAAFVEGNNAADTVKARDKADNQRRRQHEDVEDPCVIGDKPATDILIDVVPMALVYVVYTTSSATSYRT